MFRTSKNTPSLTITHFIRQSRIWEAADHFKSQVCFFIKKQATLFVSRTPFHLLGTNVLLPCLTTAARAIIYYVVWCGICRKKGLKKSSFVISDKKLALTKLPLNGLYSPPPLLTIKCRVGR